MPLASIWHDAGGSITYHVGQRRRSDLLITRGFQLVYGPIAFRSRDIFTEAEPGMPRDSEPEVKVIVEGVIWLDDNNHRHQG